MTIVYAASARAELDEMWAWNVEKHGTALAAEYLDWLQGNIDRLVTGHPDGKPVEGFPHLKRLTVRRSSRGQGHVVIFRMDEIAQRIRILHVYHTSQDIQGRLNVKTTGDESPFSHAWRAASMVRTGQMRRLSGSKAAT